jgi:hypothetical protein
LLEADVARKFLAKLVNNMSLHGLLSDEHFSVDGTQIAAWASMKSFQAKDGSSDPLGPGRNGERDFMARRPPTRRMPRPRSRRPSFIARARQGSQAYFMGHTLMENRSGFVVAATLTQATGTAERDAAETMIVRASPQRSASHSAPTRAKIQRRSWPICERST